MYLEVGTLLAPYYDVVNSTSGERIPLVQWADDSTQILEKLIYNEDGSLKEHFDSINNEYIMDREIINGNFELIGKNLFFRLLKKVINKIQK